MYGDQPHPKGVFRFKTWREFNEWKSRCWIRFSEEAAAGKIESGGAPPHSKTQAISDGVNRRDAVDP